jgi:hypothetical protein
VAAQQGAEESRRGGEVSPESYSEAYLDLDLRITEVGVDLIGGHNVQAGLVSQLFEELNQVRACRRIGGPVEAPDGHRHVRRAGFPRQPSLRNHVRARPAPVFDAGRIGAIALVTGEVSREHLACRGVLARGEVQELDDPLPIDGIVDGLPGP